MGWRSIGIRQAMTLPSRGSDADAWLEGIKWMLLQLSLGLRKEP